MRNHPVSPQRLVWASAYLAVLATRSRAFVGQHVLVNPKHASRQQLEGWTRCPSSQRKGIVLRAGEDRGAFGAGADPEDIALERKAGELERRLASAVASEDYAAASKVRDEINRLHMDEVSSVLRVNSQFYDAMTDKDAERMASVWSRSDLVQCIHPGSKPVQGHEAVLKVYRGLFAAREGRSRRSRVSPANVRVHVRGTSAWVTCTEEVRASGSALRQRLCATNIFRKEGGRWFVTHHHASAYPGGGLSAGGSGGLAELLSQGMGGGGGGGGPRIIALGSSSGEGLDQSTVEDIVNSIRQAMSEREGGSGDGLPSGIISFGVPSDGDDGDGESGRNAALKSLSGLIQAGVLGPASDAGRQKRRLRNAGKSESDDDDASGESDADGDDSDDEDESEKDLSRRAVAAVRHVEKKGLIDAAQKRVLLTDIIRHASSERPSAVEVAFELLLAGEGGETAAGEDSLAEFAEQCCVFAEQRQSATKKKTDEKDK